MYKYIYIYNVANPEKRTYNLQEPFHKAPFPRTKSHTSRRCSMGCRFSNSSFKDCNFCSNSWRSMELQNPNALLKISWLQKHTTNKKKNNNKCKHLHYMGFVHIFPTNSSWLICFSDFSGFLGWPLFSGPRWYTQWPSCQSHLVPRDACWNLGPTEAQGLHLNIQSWEPDDFFISEFWGV